MAHGERRILVRLSADRDGDVFLEGPLTLRGLRTLCSRAELDGFPLDDEIQYGWVPEALGSGLYIEKPLDMSTLPFETLKEMAIRQNAKGTQAAAWAEIRRRATESGGDA